MTCVCKIENFQYLADSFQLYIYSLCSLSL